MGTTGGEGLAGALAEAWVIAAALRAGRLDEAVALVEKATADGGGVWLARDTRLSILAAAICERLVLDARKRLDVALRVAAEQVESDARRA